MRNKSRPRRGAWATRLKRARTAKGWTQDELATRADVSRWTVMRWEQGAQEGKPEHLRRVAEAVGIPTTEAFAAIGWLTGVQIEVVDDPPAYDDPDEQYIWERSSLSEEHRRGLIAAHRALKESRSATP